MNLFVNAKGPKVGYELDLKLEKTLQFVQKSFEIRYFILHSYLFINTKMAYIKKDCSVCMLYNALKVNNNFQQVC